MLDLPKLFQQHKSNRITPYLLLGTNTVCILHSFHLTSLIKLKDRIDAILVFDAMTKKSFKISETHRERNKLYITHF